jgi:uncharacterized protein YyaL (SSP411 family)
MVSSKVSRGIIKVLLIVMLSVSLTSSERLKTMVQASVESNERPNRLIHEKSPYLLQHAHNPVDWYPWGKEAFEKARREDKPIFLSIGYSTCHWCHVMEHESFEDPEVADLMNDTFVSIKVDREERPDLDHVYMTVCQMLTGSGGWPLTIFMTPDKKPFFAATYIPKGNRFGRTGMMELIPRIKEVWKNRRDEVLDSATKVVDALQGLEKESAGAELGRPELKQAYEELRKRFDAAYGGFSTAPKFPTPHNLLFLLRYWKRSGDEQALSMVEKTLQEMRHGGIYDQIGYGFHRYSTDREWLVPHFEKMLYDQAMLAMANLEAYQATGKTFYANTAREIFTYVLRDMTDPEGGFYSAEDADSEGVEGKFYLWEKSEIGRILGKTSADPINRVFNVARDGNFKDEATGRKTDMNILHLGKTIEDIASDLDLSATALAADVAAARGKLFEVREGRIHPHKDDKVLTDWNGLMIAAFARGAQVLEEPAYADAAARAADFALDRMRKPDGRLLHRYRDGEAKIAAHLDDYAFLIWGLIELYEATFEVSYLETALELNTHMLDHFWDDHAGGLFFTSDDGEDLIIRKKEVYDGAVPSGNAVAMLNLLRLARFTGRAELEERASSMSKAFSKQIGQYPSGYTQFMVSVDFGLGPSYEVVVVGKPNAEDTREMLRSLRTSYIPNKIVIFRSSDTEEPAITRIADFVKNHVSVNGKATAYLCQDYTCKMPLTDVTEMRSQLLSPVRR